MDRQASQPIGEAPEWLEALERVSRLARLDRPILVIGERGTGKELVAERLHFLSNRWDGPYITVNCAALSEELLDSELFGHERGAFTGATDRRVGRFELADGGTIFLDEIATASDRVQEKLLRVVEYGEFQRVGGEKVLSTNVRVVAATNVDLPGKVAAGEFRADLLDRLAFDVVTLPPLRARGGDVLLLADFFARRMARELREDFPGFSPAAMAAMEAHAWPGNVRELRNFAERVTAHALADPAPAPISFDPAALDPFESPFRPKPDGAAKPTAPAPADEASEPAITGDFETQVRIFETRLIDKALGASGGHQGKAAELLGLTYHQFRGLLKKHGYGRKPGKPDTGDED